MGLLKWKNDVGRGTERKALSRGRSISGMVLDGVEYGKFKVSEVRDFDSRGLAVLASHRRQK
jgi:hypothetical protein